MSSSTPESVTAPIHITNEIEQHSLPKSIILHLLPGIPIVLFYIIASPFFLKLGFSTTFTLCLAIVVVLIPVELGFLLYLGKKGNGRFSLKGIVLYREKAKAWQYIVYGLIIFMWSILVFVILSKPLGSFIIENFFSWAPAWYITESFEGSQSILLITWIMLMIFGNILGPAVEELYFRGYLLPRISRFKGWASLLNAFLFAAYHFWSPWQVITRTVAVFPLSFIVYKTKNIYIGMFSHILLNILSSLSMLALIFK